MLSRGPLLHALISVFELPEDDTVPDDEHFIEIEDTPGTLVSFYYANISIRTAWLVQLVRALPSDIKVPRSIPSSAKILTFVLPLPPKLTQLSILPGQVTNEYKRLLGAKLRWISVPSRGSQTRIRLTLQKLEIWGCQARKGLSQL